MSIRGDNTRSLILTHARRLFAKFGFSEVTMKDVADACGLSRGGLYRHFDSTGKMFASIIENEQIAALRSLEKARANDVSSTLILKTFITHRFGLVANSEESIDNAISEFAANDESGRELLIKRAQASVDILADMIRAGVSEGSFACSDPENTALHIMWVIEGAAKHNALIPLTSDEINAQIDIILSLLGA